jgi:hypothetical protein
MDTNRHSDPKKAEMILALESTKGVVTDAAEIAGIARSTHYLWMTEDKVYKDAVNDLQDVVLDFAENKLFKLVDKGDVAATLFLLKTKGKKRGYVERTEVSPVDPDGNAVQPIININVIRTKKEIDDSL